MGRGRRRELLLDTCAIIFLFNGEPVAADFIEAADSATILISPISAWEIGILGQKRSTSGPVFSPDPVSWFNSVLAAPSVQATPFDADIALASCQLPGALHRDPADRFLIATARKLAIPLVTRDRLILEYAAAGFVDALVC